MSPYSRRGYKLVLESIGAPVGLAWLLVVFFFYFRQSPPLLEYFISFLKQYSEFSLWHPYTVKAVAALLLAGWIAWIAIKCGAELLRKLLPGVEISQLEERIFSASLGV